MSIKIISLNCRGLNGLKKRLRVFHYLKSLDGNIFCLQDTHFTPEMQKNIYSEWDGECFLSYGTSNSRGTAILFRKNFEFKINNECFDQDGNFVALDMSIEENKITLVNLYGPNLDNPEFYQNIFDIVDNFGNEQFIICGDYNLVIDPEMDYYNYKSVNNKKAREKLLKYIAEQDLIDPFRVFHPNLKRFTWRRCNPLQQARLDFFLVSSSFNNFISKCEIQPSVQSDHSCILIDFQFNNFKHGKGLWKHNNSLLKDAEYLKIINRKIYEIKLQYAILIYSPENIKEILIINGD